MFKKAYRILRSVARKSQAGAYFVWCFFFIPIFIGGMALLDILKAGQPLIQVTVAALSWAVAVSIVYRMRE